MSAVADAAKLLANLAGLGQQFAFVNDPNFKNEEYLAASLTSMFADAPAAVVQGGQMIYRPVANACGAAFGLGKDAVKSSAAGSTIAAAISVVDAMELLTGFGPPYDGGPPYGAEGLQYGSRQFYQLGGLLGSALPDDRWQGAAAQAYADQVAKLQELATTLSELDTSLLKSVKDQAAMVTHIRLGFGVLKDILVALLLIELAMRANGVGASVIEPICIAASVLGISAAIAMLSYLGNFSAQCARDGDSLAGLYRWATPEPVTDFSPDPTHLAAAAQTRVAGFEPLSHAAVVNAEVPRFLGGEWDPRAEVGAGVNAGQPPQDGGSANLDGLQQIEFVEAMPTLAQLTAWSGQAVSVSGQLSAHANLVNQAMGQVQQLASLGRQGQAAPYEQDVTDESAIDEAAYAGNGHGAVAGAASGSGPGGRAPLAPVGPQEFSQTNPLRPIV